MTKQTRRKFTPEFKAKVALEAAKDQLTLAQLSQKFEVNAVTISKWKSEFLANLSATFSNVKETENSEPEVPVEKLYAQIGKLKVELDFLKKSAKKLGIPESEWKPSNLGDVHSRCADNANCCAFHAVRCTMRQYLKSLRI
jgi:transposase-like protein